MKYLLSAFLIGFVLSSCEKEEIVINQISFEINGEEIQCDRDFYSSSDIHKDYFSFSGNTTDVRIWVEIYNFHGKGAYSIDHKRHISIWRGNDIITTSDTPDKPQGSGRIIIEKISKKSVSGTFECVSLDNISITNGKFQLMREEN